MNAGSDRLGQSEGSVGSLQVPATVGGGVVVVVVGGDQSPHIHP